MEWLLEKHTWTIHGKGQGKMFLLLGATNILPSSREASGARQILWRILKSFPYPRPTGIKKVRSTFWQAQ